MKHKPKDDFYYAQFIVVVFFIVTLLFGLLIYYDSKNIDFQKIGDAYISSKIASKRSVEKKFPYYIVMVYNGKSYAPILIKKQM